MLTRSLFAITELLHDIRYYIVSYRFLRQQLFRRKSYLVICDTSGVSETQRWHRKLLPLLEILQERVWKEERRILARYITKYCYSLLSVSYFSGIDVLFF